MTIVEEDAKAISKEYLYFELPARLIMTNSTISMFYNNNYTTQDITLDIFQSYFFYPPEHPNCFEVKQSEALKIYGCALPSYKNPREFLNKWDYDFNLFKYQCRENRDVFNSENQTMKIFFDQAIVFN